VKIEHFHDRAVHLNLVSDAYSLWPGYMEIMVDVMDCFWLFFPATTSLVQFFVSASCFASM
jgi:hypothetical protein